MQDKKIIVASLILIALGTGAYFYISKGSVNLSSAGRLEAIKVKAEKFINEKLVQPGTGAVVKSIVEESGIYKIMVAVGTQEIAAYISKDGKNFYPQVYDMDEQKTAQTGPSQTADQSVAKKDKPTAELFVMSYCPYGLQMEKGILPAVKLLGSKITFQLKFVDYAMHGQKEIDENLRQYCIQKESPKKLLSYLDCFNKLGDASACLASAKIDSSLLAVCASQTNAQFKINAKAADKNQWRNQSYPPFDIYQADNAKYGVQGSPTLIINGVSIQSARDPQSLLAAICSGFAEQPSECQQKLSTSAPASGFGSGTDSGSASQCSN